MDDLAQVSVAELRAAFDRLLTEVERRFGSEIHLDDRHYWLIWPAEAFDFDPESRPSVLVGDLSDDIAEVRGLLARDLAEEDVILWHDLRHFIGVLTRLAAVGGA